MSDGRSALVTGSSLLTNRIAARLIPIFLLAWALAGCQESADTATVVRFWAMGREGEVVRELIPDFERAHPNVRVEVQQLPWTAAHQKLLTAFAGDALPDVAQLGNTWLPEFVALRAVDPVDPSVVDVDDYFAGIWQTNVLDQTAYGVPWYIDTRLLFYRRDLLAAAGYAAPPTTWEEWVEMLRALEQRAAPHSYGVLLPLNEYEPLLALAAQQEAPLLRDGDTRGNFRSDGFKRALRFYLDMFEDGFAPATGAHQIANTWDEFARGHFTFYITGPWNIGEFKRRLPASLQASWMTAPLPGANGPGYSTAGGASLVVFSGSPRKKEAWQLVQYLSRPDVQLRFHAMTGNLPPRRSAWNDERLQADVYARAFREQLERVKPAPMVPEWERIASEMQLVAERMVQGGRMTVDEAAAEIDRRADRILEKRRWLLARKEQP
ncbi:MAG: sugar ABC transporter substrate-binding protein [Hyphomicrobium sp.]|nr:sugar ABC transporter substrate-binding protein [Hyphomicrobium sp.]